MFPYFINSLGAKKFAVVKIDDSEFFDEIDLKLKTGLPVSKNRVQRSAVITFSDKNKIEKLTISGTRNTSYWFQIFLCAKPILDSKSNTENVWKEVSGFISREIGDISKADATFFKNDLISYLNHRDTFKFSDIVEMLETYKPKSEELNKKKASVVQKLRELPQKARKKFDTEFEILHEALSAKVKRTIILDDNFELRLNGEIKDLRNKIVAGKENERKFLKIYSDRGYNQFTEGNNN